MYSEHTHNMHFPAPSLGNLVPNTQYLQYCQHFSVFNGRKFNVKYVKLQKKRVYLLYMPNELSCFDVIG